MAALRPDTSRYRAARGRIASTSVSAVAARAGRSSAISAIAVDTVRAGSAAGTGAAKRSSPCVARSTRRARRASGTPLEASGRELGEPRTAPARRRRRARDAGQPCERHQPAHPAHGRVHPVGQERGGVDELVGLLLDLERPQQAFVDRAVAVQEGRPGAGDPLARSRRRGRVAGRARHTGRGGRTTAASPPRRAARARARPFGHGLGRLALEVEDDQPARVGALHLADVEVAVHPLQRDRPGGRLERRQLGQDPGPVRRAARRRLRPARSRGRARAEPRPRCAIRAGRPRSPRWSRTPQAPRAGGRSRRRAGRCRPRRRR